MDINYDDDTFILTFPDPDVADKWWRAISDTPAIASFFTRVNPQFYTYTATSLKVSNFFTDSQTQNIAFNFRGKLFITKVDDKIGRGLPIVRSVNVPNIMNENWFYIRSITSPHYYWYYDTSFGTGKPLTVSETPCTRFQLHASSLAKNIVLTGQDWFTLRVYVKTSTLYLTFNFSDDGYFPTSVGPLPNTGINFDILRHRLILRLPEKCLEFVNHETNPAGRVWELIE